MPGRLTTVQLGDEYGNPLAPLTMAKSVYMAQYPNPETGEKRTLQEQVDYMDIDNINEIGEEALSNVVTSGTTAYDEVYQAGLTYREDIDSLSGTLQTLMDISFPLKINAEIHTDIAKYMNTLSFTVTEFEYQEPNIKKAYIEKTVNDGSQIKILEQNNYLDMYTVDSEIQGKKEHFEFYAETDNKTANERMTRYLVFYGASNSQSMTSSMALGLSKRLVTGVSFNPTITTVYGQYIWLVIPSELTITKVTSNGFDVPLHEFTGGVMYQTVNVGNFGSYKAYRTENALDDATWTLNII